MLSIVGFIMTSAGLIVLFITFIIDIFILIKIITFRRRNWDITVVTVVNTYVSLLVAISILFWIIIATFLGDLNYQIFQDSTVCHILGHLFIPSFSYVFNSFPLEAFARFSLVVHRQDVWQRSILAIVVFTVAGNVYSNVVYVIGIPLYNLKYLPEESNCGVDLLAWKGILYIFILINTVPIVFLNIIYFLMLKHIRRSSLVVQNARQINNSRDMFVTKRMITIMIIATHIGIPPTILWMVATYTGRLYSLSYRIGSLCFALCVSFSSIGLALTNSHVKLILWHEIRFNRAERISGQNTNRHIENA